MRLARHALSISGLALVGLTLGLWTLSEARRQRQETAAALGAEAHLLARALAPGLVAASTAVREVDELVSWKMLDNGRLLAELERRDSLDPVQLERLAEANGLDAVAIVDGSGDLLWTAGERVPASVVAAAAPVFGGSTEELVFGSSMEQGADYLTVVVAVPERGGAVILRVQAESARPFLRQVGVRTLLENLIGTGSVLYLAYREQPSGLAVDVSWDDRAVPTARPGGDGLRSVRGRQVFEVLVPLEVRGGRRASVRVGLDGQRLDDAATSAMRRTLLVGVVLVCFALVAVAFAVVSALRTNERAEAARKLAEAEAGRRRSERLAAAGALTAGLAHEVRSPLNAIGLAAQRIERRHEEEDDCRSFAGLIRKEVRRLEGVLVEFLDLARPIADRSAPVDLGVLATEVHDLLEAEAEDRGLELSVVQGGGTVRGDREALRRALINLTRNALQASEPGTCVSTVIEETRDGARVLILDRGAGLDDEMRERVFEAFVTTRASGTGLGLSLVRRVAEEHGGSCVLEPREGGGSVACLTLPKNQASEGRP